MAKNNTNIPSCSNHTPLFDHVAQLIEQARQHVKTAINTAMVYTYFNIGRYIVEDEQRGEQRAAYGDDTIKELSRMLEAQYGKGWSVAQLKNIRQFYIVYSAHSTLAAKKAKHRLANSGNVIEKLNTVEPIDGNSVNSAYETKFTLSWSHYLILMRIADPAARSFYEIECKKQDWSVRQLKRQVGSLLYERLALSRDKDAVMRLANEGQTVEKAADIVKDPYVLEFLGLKEEASYSETKLEKRIISKMRDFLLELGKGFLFEAEQKRFTFDEDHFYVDLVFYNRLLQCYVLIDLKTDKLSHQDLGQMQMYVNYFDRYVRQSFENPTIGILLCKEKSDALVELTLPKDANIYASAYQLYLPDKQLLQAKVREWVAEFEESEENNDKK